MTLKRNCKDSIYQYLTVQNRPYSANDIMQNMHREFGKTAMQKALDDLISENKVKEKTYGKQKVYSVVQEEESSSEDVALELVSLDSRIEEINAKIKVAEVDLKKVEESFKLLESEPSTQRALDESSEIEVSLHRLREKIDTLSKTSLHLTEMDKRKMSKNYEFYAKEYRKRKKLCMDIISSIMENYPKTLNALLEEIGIETDDQNNFH